MIYYKIIFFAIALIIFLLQFPKDKNIKKFVVLRNAGFLLFSVLMFINFQLFYLLLPYMLILPILKNKKKTALLLIMGIPFVFCVLMFIFQSDLYDYYYCSFLICIPLTIAYMNYRNKDDIHYTLSSLIILWAWGSHKIPIVYLALLINLGNDFVANLKNSYMYWRVIDDYKKYQKSNRGREVRWMLRPLLFLVRQRL